MSAVPRAQRGLGRRRRTDLGLALMGSGERMGDARSSDQLVSLVSPGGGAAALLSRLEPEEG